MLLSMKMTATRLAALYVAIRRLLNRESSYVGVWSRILNPFGFTVKDAHCFPRLNGPFSRELKSLIQFITRIGFGRFLWHCGSSRRKYFGPNMRLGCS